MKFLKARYLPLLTAIAGVLGFILRLVLGRFGMDEKGLLVTGHFAGILLFILTALLLAALFLGVRELRNISSYTRIFPASVFGFGGCILAAVGILLSALADLRVQRDNFTVVLFVLTVLCAVCLVLLGICRMKGTQPGYLLYTCVTVYMMVQLISEYRFWSPEPQLLLYFFPLLAMVFLMLTAYQATCLAAGKGSRRWYVFCNQAAVFFCCISLLSSHWVFYLSMGLWAATNLCSLNPFKKQPLERKEA